LAQSDTYGTTNYAYNPFDEVCWMAPANVAIPSNSSCTNGPAAGSGATFYTYDSYGNLIEEVDPMGVATYYGYDSNGMPCWQTVPGTGVSSPPPACSSPPGDSTRFSYNAGAELQSESTPDGIGTSYSYDKTTYPSYNSFGEALTEVSPDGNVSGGVPANYTTTYVYDPAGRLYKVEAPMSRTTTATLDAAGNVDAVTDPAGDVTSAAYDADNRTCWTYQGSTTSTSCSSPPAGSTRYTYNVNTSDPLNVEDPDNNSTKYTYLDPDYPDSPTTVKDAVGSSITSNVYDKDGNLCVTGAESTSLYGGADPTCTWTSGYTYDTFDQLGNQMSTEDPNGKTTSYARNQPDFPGDVSTVTPPSGTNEGATQYLYDLDGRLHTEGEGNNSVITTTYGATGVKCWQAPVNEPTATCSTAVPTVAGTSSWVYYNSQLPLEMADVTSSGTNDTIWSYDSQGQETGEADIVGSTTSVIGYAYDYAGDNTCVAYPVVSTSSCLSAASRSNTVVDYGYDSDGRMTSMNDWLTSTQYPQGNSSSFGYDTRSNLTSITYPATTTWTEGFGTYDAADNSPSVGLTSPSYGSSSESLQYDPDERFDNQGGTAIWYNSKNQVSQLGGDQYGYYPNGEFETDTPSSGAVTTLSYNADAELTSKAVGTTSTSYGYNANGDRCASIAGTTAPTCTTGTTTYGWSPYNQLSSITGASTTSTYSYNGEGLRTSDTVSSSSQSFYYDTQTRPGQPLIIEDGTNAYLYGPDNYGSGTAPIEQISLSTGAATFLTSAPTGVFALLSSAGAVVGTESYSTYGVETATGTVSTPFGFQGAYTDVSGLNYLINRYYDPTTDQYLSVDPEVAVTGQPYAFTGDDPVNATDPLGLCSGPDAICTNPVTGALNLNSSDDSSDWTPSATAPPPPATNPVASFCGANAAYCLALQANPPGTPGHQCLVEACSSSSATSSGSDSVVNTLNSVARYSGDVQTGGDVAVIGCNLLDIACMAAGAFISEGGGIVSTTSLCVGAIVEAAHDTYGDTESCITGVALEYISKGLAGSETAGAVFDLATKAGGWVVNHL
jgi:RHS repeat-associated protein